MSFQDALRKNGRWPGRHELPPESLGLGVRVMNAQRWKCGLCRKVTNPGALGMHQKWSGHRGKTKLS